MWLVSGKIHSNLMNSFQKPKKIDISFQQSTANPELVTDGGESAETFSVFFWWMCGISLLTIALFISARMGIYQEVLYKRFGKYPREALYITVCAKKKPAGIRKKRNIQLISY